MAMGALVISHLPAGGTCSVTVYKTEDVLIIECVLLPPCAVCGVGEVHWPGMEAGRMLHVCRIQHELLVQHNTTPSGLTVVFDLVMYTCLSYYLFGHTTRQ